MSSSLMSSWRLLTDEKPIPKMLRLPSICIVPFGANRTKQCLWISGTFSSSGTPADYTSMPRWWVSFFTAMLPRELGDLDRKDWKNVLGTGPFIPTDFISGGTTTFKKNPNYWDYDPLHPENRLPYLDGMKMIHFSGDWGAQVAALRTGKLDKIARLVWGSARLRG